MKSVGVDFYAHKVVNYTAKFTKCWNGPLCLHINEKKNISINLNNGRGLVTYIF